MKPPGMQLICEFVNVLTFDRWQIGLQLVDDPFDVSRAQIIDVLFLTETWHDTDSICFRRLRAEGFQVVDCARPR